MGSEVVMFFTGANALRRGGPQAGQDPVGSDVRLDDAERRRGVAVVPDAHGWIGTALMRRVMRAKQVDSLPGMIAQARPPASNWWSVQSSMDVMGLKWEELIDAWKSAASPRS